MSNVSTVVVLTNDGYFLIVTAVAMSSTCPGLYCGRMMINGSVERECGVSIHFYLCLHGTFSVFEFGFLSNRFSPKIFHYIFGGTETWLNNSKVISFVECSPLNLPSISLGQR